MLGRARTPRSPLNPAEAGPQASPQHSSRRPLNFRLGLGRHFRGHERIWELAALLFLSPAAAFAHPGHDAFGQLGFAAGFIHPFTGADHMLVMVSVGLWAALRGGTAMWAWPAAFVAALLAGFTIGYEGVTLPMAEPAILASIIVLGALTAADARAPTAVGVALIALFGLAHGYAHGAESPGAAAGFLPGMALATLLLHGAGLAAAIGLQRLQRPALVRLLGLGAAASGLLLATGA
jgi:urease accessory protein